MLSLQLRPYQRDCLDKIKEFSSSRCSNQLIYLPTGSRKTIIFSHLIQETQKHTLVLAHTNELPEQAKEKIEMVCPDIKARIVNSEAKQFDTPILISDIQAERFVEASIPLLAIHGKISKSERSDILAQYKIGKINVLCNFQVLTEGLDTPQTDCIVARPTQSVALYQQMVSRSLHLFPNKSDCLVTDFSDKNHTLCNMAILIGNKECVFHDENKQCTKYDLLKQRLPPKFNQKKVLLNFDPLGENFSWQREPCGSYLLKWSSLKQIKIKKDQEERLSVFLLNGSSRTSIAISISFEYALGAAKDYTIETYL